MAILEAKVKEAKAEKREASIRERRQLCLSAFDSAQELLASRKPSDTPKRIVATANAVIEQLATVAKSSPVSGQKVRFARAHNYLKSYRDSFASGEITQASLGRLYSKISEVLDEERPRLVEHKATAAGESEEETNDSGVRNEEYLDLITKEVERIKGKYATYSQGLRTLVNKPFILVRAPIIPLFNGSTFINMGKLSHMGIAAEKVGEYVVLENQLLLGINPSHIDELHKKYKKQGIEIAEHLLSLVEQKTKKQHIIMGPATRHATGVYYWIPAQTEVNLLGKAVAGKFSIKKWGFAFNEN